MSSDLEQKAQDEVAGNTEFGSVRGESAGPAFHRAMIRRSISDTVADSTQAEIGYAVVAVLESNVRLENLISRLLDKLTSTERGEDVGTGGKSVPVTPAAPASTKSTAKKKAPVKKKRAW